MASKNSNVPAIMRQGNLTPWFYLLPALIVMTTFIIYPGINTFWLSFRNTANTGWASDSCVAGQSCWGFLENFHYALTSQIMQTAFINNLKWILLMVSGTVILGLLIAVLADRVKIRIGGEIHYISPDGDFLCRSRCYLEVYVQLRHRRCSDRAA